ncbi:MAG: hypothetical protein QOK71_08690, partial [Nitrososphaeraceae archaeon]|nr:hypothetical protein [Nitrososphaeraceae archaeon]
YFYIHWIIQNLLIVLIDKVWYLVITYYLKFYQYYQDTFSCSSNLLVKTIIIIICNYQQNIGDLTAPCLLVINL